MSPTQSHQPKSPNETRLALEVLRLKEAAKALPHGTHPTKTPAIALTA
jgi:hypothetical protein